MKCHVAKGWEQRRHSCTFLALPIATQSCSPLVSQNDSHTCFVGLRSSWDVGFRVKLDKSGLTCKSESQHQALLLRLRKDNWLAQI